MPLDRIVLHDGGYLSAEGPFGGYDLILAEDGLTWLLLDRSAPEAGGGAILARYPDLEFALRLLAGAAGYAGPFQLDLPCGNVLRRPGQVPVAGVLAAFGYAAVRSLTAYVLVEAPSARAARNAAAARLAGLSATVDEIEPIDGEGPAEGWCCALTLLDPGLFAHAEADWLAESFLFGRGLRLIGRAELDLGPHAAPPNSARVIPLRTAA